MEACRVGALFRDVVSFSLQSFRRFCSSPSTASYRASRYFSDDNEGGSSVYRNALKFQRPSTIKWQPQLRNSVSFIGKIDRPLKMVNSKTGLFVSHTSLAVKTSPDSNRPFKILLKMWDEMAEMSIRHLKPNDFIYVSGHLGLYTKTDMNGKLRTYYEVKVNQINFVAHYGQGSTCQKSEKSETGDSGETALERYKNRLHLWQEFFANPYEWRDCRKDKVNPNRPDFKHKDSGEALWLRSYDPPWIKKQLQRHDSRLAEGGKREHGRFGSHISPMTKLYDLTRLRVISDRVLSRGYEIVQLAPGMNISEVDPDILGNFPTLPG